VIAVLAAFNYLVIAAALVLLRPSPATWAFYAFFLPRLFRRHANVLELAVYCDFLAGVVVNRAGCSTRLEALRTPPGAELPDLLSNDDLVVLRLRRWKSPSSATSLRIRSAAPFCRR
jgi:hypothetical protein